MKRFGWKQAIAGQILLSMFMLTVTAFIIFIVYLVLTPVQNTFFNTLSSFLSANPNNVSPSGLSAIQKIMSTSVTQWSLLFTIAIVGTLVTIYVVAYRDEPVESQQDFEY